MRTVRRTCMMLAAVVYAATAMGPLAAKHRVLIPAERPLTVEPPFQVDLLEAGGARGVRIVEGAGRGWCNEAKGSATYTFYVPQGGSYVLWTYALWRGPCTNAVYVQVDDHPRTILGNDPVYGTWHWVRGVDYALGRGTHRLRLSNHSDGIALRQLLWLSDPYEQPGGERLASYDIFYDGFDGCDGGNADAWQRDAEGWDIQQSGSDTSGDRYLAGCSPGRPVFAVTGEDGWTDYAVSLRLNLRKAGTAGIAFDWRGQQEHMVLRWRPSVDPETGSGRIELVRVTEGKAAILAGEDAALPLDRWCDVAIEVSAGRLIVTLDGRVAAGLPGAEALRGKLALLVDDGGQAWFDEVHVRKHAPSVTASAAAGQSMGGQSCAARGS